MIVSPSSVSYYSNFADEAKLTPTTCGWYIMVPNAQITGPITHKSVQKSLYLRL